jgi:sulfopyruvate decarboxylase TPP-binding subunit
LNEKIQTKVFDYLELKGVTDFLGVPDSTMKYFIKQGLKKRKILITTREEEAIGIAAGISLSKGYPLVFMQNAGFANSLSTITSLIQLYEIPMILLIGWRGYLKNDAPEHTKIGQIQPKLIKALGIKSKILDEKSWKDTCNWAIKELKNKKLICLIIKREFID